MILMALMLNACTLNISTIETNGYANDVIDEDMKTDAQVSPSFSLPVKAI